jgi:hypothetical protein
VTAATRHIAASDAPAVPHFPALPDFHAVSGIRATTEVAARHWRRAVDIRREWLHCGLSTEPADRTATEQALTTIYARLRRPRPRFVWVDSPRQALPLVAGLPTLDILYQWVIRPPHSGPPPLASDLAAALSRLRGALDERITRPDFEPPPPKRKKAQEPWPVPPPLDALRAGIPFREVLRQGVRDALRTSLADGFSLPVRGSLAEEGTPAVCWYGQQEAYWIGYYDTWRRLGLAQYSPVDDRQLDVWATLARSCGWWWPGETVCVVVERPAVIRVERVPGGHHEQVRPRRDDGPAIEYRDGWCPDV